MSTSISIWISIHPHHIRCYSTHMKVIHEERKRPTTCASFTHVRIYQLVKEIDSTFGAVVVTDNFRFNIDIFHNYISMMHGS